MRAAVMQRSTSLTASVCRQEEHHPLAANLQRCLAAQMAGAGGDARQHRRGSGLGLFLTRQRGLARLFRLHRGGGDKILPDEQHRRRQEDGQENILVVVHGVR